MTRERLDQQKLSLLENTTNQTVTNANTMEKEPRLKLRYVHPPSYPNYPTKRFQKIWIS